MAIPATLNEALANTAATTSQKTDATNPGLSLTAADLKSAISKNNVVADSPIYFDILHPVLVNLPLIDAVSKQASLLTASSGSETFGTFSAAKPNPKPFIIGFIVPDVPINYLPVTSGKNNVGSINDSSTKPQQGPSGVAINTPYGKAGAPGLQPKKWTTFSSSDLKREIISYYTSATGKPPTDQTVALIYCQMAMENGQNSGVRTFGCSNYNLGNYHAGGGEIILDGKPASIAGLPVPPPPKGGSYYLTYDTRPTKSGTQYYACYMQNYDNLHDATARQLGQLFYLWPGTATAQTPEEFNNALIPRKTGGKVVTGDYYEAPPEKYLAALKSSLSTYYAAQGTQPPGSGLEAQNSKSANSANNGRPVGSIMDNGDVCGSNDDLLSTDLGRRIKIDTKRREVTDKYVQSIKRDIEAVRKIPPLLMLINPSSFERSYDRGADSGVKGRQGPIVHMWLEKPMTISCKGVTAAQYAVDASGSGGLTQTNRVQSLSYQALMSLVLMYKNNGQIFDSFSDASGSLGVPIIQMSLYIYYDNHMYIGTFDDFSVEDSVDKPYNMAYSFKFHVRYDIDVLNSSVNDVNITSQFAIPPRSPNGTQGTVPNG